MHDVESACATISAIPSCQASHTASSLTIGIFSLGWSELELRNTKSIRHSGLVASIKSTATVQNHVRWPQGGQSFSACGHSYTKALQHSKWKIQVSNSSDFWLTHNFILPPDSVIFKAISIAVWTAQQGWPLTSRWALLDCACTVETCLWKPEKCSNLLPPLNVPKYLYHVGIRVKTHVW